jgi:Type VI secretion system effector, Hcp
MRGLPSIPIDGSSHPGGGPIPETDTKQSVAALIKRPLLAGALATAAAASIATPVPALADTFLSLSGILGESTDAKHKDEINVLSFTQSWINTMTTSGNQGKVQCGAITVMKNIDRSSPPDKVVGQWQTHFVRPAHVPDRGHPAGRVLHDQNVRDNRDRGHPDGYAGPRADRREGRAERTRLQLRVSSAERQKADSSR